MSDYIIVNGDKVRFMRQFGAATVTVRPGTITGTGAGGFQKKKLCVAGDEYSVAVPLCPYFAGDFQGGTGTLRILKLTDQIAAKTRSGNKPVLLMGSKFIAIFIPKVKALNPVGVPDPVPFYIGSGNFGHPANFKKLKGT